MAKNQKNQGFAAIRDVVSSSRFRESRIYRYALGECFHEFGIPGEATGEIYNVDVYVSGQMPIYDYGEEIVED